MMDSSRPVAPFLPPEIIDRILHFIYRFPVIDFARLSLISSAWRIHAQKKLFHGIHIESNKKLLKLLAAIAQNGTGRFIKHLTVIESGHPSSQSSSHLYFLLLHSTPNLVYLSFNIHEYKGAFSRAEFNDSMEISNIYLPNLVEMDLESNSTDWDRCLYQPLLLGSPNLIKLQLDFPCRYSSKELWTTPSFSKLRELNLTGKGIVGGRIFDVACFEGLEKLVINGTKVSRSTSIPFFRAIGPTLKELDVYLESGLPPSLYSLLPVLEVLCVNPLCEPEEDLTNFTFPDNLIRLSVCGFEGPLLPLTGLPKLKHIELYSRSEKYDLSTLPPLEDLFLENITRVDLLKSMEQLIVGKIPFKKISLGSVWEEWSDQGSDEETEVDSGPMGDWIELSEEGSIKNRCRELGIHMVSDELDRSTS